MSVNSRREPEASACLGRRLVVAGVGVAEGALGLDHGLDVGRLPHPAAPQLLDVRPRPLVEAEPRALLFGLAIEGSAEPWRVNLSHELPLHRPKPIPRS